MPDPSCTEDQAMPHNHVHSRHLLPDYLLNIGQTKPDTESFTLRNTLKTSDISPICELVKHAGIFDHNEVNIAKQQISEAVNRKQSRYRFQLIVNDKNIPVAFCCYGEIPLTFHRFDVYWLVVSPHYQRRGFASQLLSVSEQDILKLGGSKCYIETSGLSGYAAARALYTRHGYEQVACLKDYYKLGDDRIIYYKPLSF